MKKEFVFLLVASLAQIGTANKEWMEDCKNQSANIQIHSAGGDWRNLTSDVTSDQYFWIDRTFTCTADPYYYALVRINDMMDLPLETKTITCGPRRKWMYKGEVVLNVGCYTGIGANWVQKSEEEERIRNWMSKHHGAKEDQKDWTWGSTQYKQQKKMQRMASEIQNLLVNNYNIIRKQVAVVPADYVDAWPESWSLIQFKSANNYYMRTAFVGFGDDSSVLEFANYVIFVFRGGFPDRSKPDAKEDIRHYFQDEFKSRERHDVIHSLAERAATYGDKWEGRVDIVTVFRKGAYDKTCTYLYGASGDWMLSEVKTWSRPCQRFGLGFRFGFKCGAVCVVHLTA